MLQTCPYCNSQGAVIAGPGGRPACGRCGEALPASYIEGSPAADRVASTPGRPRPALGWQAYLAGFLLVTIVTIVFIRFTKQAPKPLPSAPPVAGLIAPVAAPGLGYLPESTDVVAAVHIPQVMEQLGMAPEADPRQALSRLGMPDQFVEAIDRATAVGLKNVDHLLVGVAFEPKNFPPLILVVARTKAPFGPVAIARQSKSREFKKDGRALHAVKVVGELEAHWWAPDDRTVVAALMAKDLAGLPARPRDGLDHLRSPLQEELRRLPADSVAWVAGASDRWGQHLSPYVTLPFLNLPLVAGRKDLLASAERLRTVALAVPSTADGEFVCDIGLKTEEAASDLRGRVRDRFQGEAVAVGGQDGHVRVTAPADLGKIGSVLGRLIGPPTN